MARILWTYGVTAIVVLILDGLWLSAMVNRFYRPRIGSLMRADPDIIAAALFYFLFVGGIVAFVALPAFDDPRWTAPAWRGALFGLITYATYDLTNQATVRGWSWRVTGVDLLWGIILSAIAGTLGVMGARLLMR